MRKSILNHYIKEKIEVVPVYDLMQSEMDAEKRKALLEGYANYSIHVCKAKNR